MKNISVYLDYNATTPPKTSAYQGAKKAIEYWGNPSSVHQSSRKAKALLWSSRQSISKFLGCDPLEVIFTSGASEANNQAIKGLFTKKNQKRNELLISSVEHPSILSTADFLSSQGWTVHKIPVSKNGFLDEEVFEKKLTEKSLLVSIMLANNETGVLFPIQKFAKKAHEKGALFHSDMTQGLGKIPINLEDIDLASFSAHKCYGLKGCGVLYCKKGIHLESLIHGGNQERSRRAGTENLFGISAFAAISQEGESILQENKKLKKLRDEMEENILSSLSEVTVIGQTAPRLDNTSCLYIKGIEGETLFMNLDLKGISVSVGSACGSGKMRSNSILSSMGWKTEVARSALRVSLGIGTTKKHLEYFQNNLKECVERLRKLEI